MYVVETSRLSDSRDVWWKRLVCPIVGMCVVETFRLSDSRNVYVVETSRLSDSRKLCAPPSTSTVKTDNVKLPNTPSTNLSSSQSSEPLLSKKCAIVFPNVESIHVDKYFVAIGEIIGFKNIIFGGKSGQRMVIRSVLEQQRSDGLDRLGSIKLSLALCVMAVFLLVYFSLWKGVRSAGKVKIIGIRYYVCKLFLFTGVGYAICLMDIYMGMYYNTIIGWAVYYLFASFRSELPWTSCNNAWNTANCTPVTVHVNYTSSSPAKEFFERSVLEQQRSDGLDRLGSIKLSLALCVMAVFLLVYFSLWKGVRSAGKAVWVTALAPYVVLIILLCRGVTLPGADEGIRYYLTPQWHKLKNSKVWIDAASQIFFSLGPGFGTLLALSSYNKFDNNCYRDAILTSSINCLTSFLAGFVIFSVLGYMAHVQNKSVADVGLEGPGLVFIVYPEAIAMMTGSVFWSIIFFLMLITLGLDSTFGGLEAMITALCDEYPRLLGRHREIFVAVVVTFVYICALPTTTYGGVYLVNFLNVFGPGLAILFVVFVEAAGVCWIYGVDRFSTDIESMLGHRPGLYWRLCWTYISPFFLLTIFVFSLLGYEDMISGEYVYPPWSIRLGWTLTASSLMCIPSYIVYKLYTTPGPLIKRIYKIMQPEEVTEPVVITTVNTYGTVIGTHV
ncbi:sodium-dependent serotonin transporter-like [Diaphorina citri]|uniref:Sodium-dependent serotonin transporter-like n=1 Tax=Diaphorina citri TaxID=121845 RepID=A0A3Q0IU20_DIACI|nr:sodium-dependent serotonin transporter-like [Diaphorina citri]